MTISEERVEQVNEWAIELIEGWLEENKIDPDTALASSCIDHINWNKMLTKEQAKWLGQIIEDKLDNELRTMDMGRGHMSAVQWVDELSIYPDAWYHYCRPGAYSISI